MGINPGLHLQFPAEAGSIGRARAAVCEMAEELGMKRTTLMDLKVMVSEACTNVVRHAYPDGDGDFELEAFLDDTRMKVIVSDFGQGIRPSLHTSDSLQLGIGLMSMLSSNFAIDGGDGRGTRVTIEVPLDQ